VRFVVVQPQEILYGSNDGCVLQHVIVVQVESIDACGLPLSVAE
jgi:hypothetical protein